MLIINANIKTMESSDFENGYILIENGKIVDVGDMQKRPTYSGETLDAKGSLAFPGFIDPHCHIGMIGDGLGFESEDVNEETDPVTPQLRAIDAVNALDKCFEEAINGGVTTVLTGAGSANPIAGQWLAMKTYGKRVDDMAIASPIGMKFALGENPKMTYNVKNQVPITRMATAALIREQLEKAKRYMADREKAENDEDLDGPEYDIKCEAILPVLKREIKAFFHAHRADDIFTAIRISKEFNLDYVIIHATEGHEIADILKKEDAKVVLGPILSDRCKPELKNLTVKNAAILEKAGVELAICTDHPETPIQFLALTAAVASREGLSPDMALRAITINAAKIVGIESRVGSLKVGKDADICLFSESPLLVTSKPSHVFINGELLGGTAKCESLM